MGSEKELHCTPSGSRSAADVPVPRVLYAHATRFVLYNPEHVFLKYANSQNTLTVVWLFLQVILDLLWIPRVPTYSVTALMIISTCSMSVE